MKKFFLVSALVLITAAGTGGTALAYDNYLTDFNNTYGTANTALDTCNLCHRSSYSRFNAYGSDFRGTHSFTNIESIDSDGDGFSNIDEIDAETFPGDAGSFPEITTQPSPPSADAGPDQTVDSGDTVTLNASNSTDSDQDITGYAWVQTAGETVILSDPSSVSPVFDAPVVFGNGTALTFMLTVTDSTDLTGTDVCIVNVAAQNRAPLADAGPDRTVDAGTDVILSGLNSSDPDGDDISYSWAQTSGAQVTLLDPEAAETGFTAPENITESVVLVFTLTVIDGPGLMDSDTCTVNVNPVSVPEPNAAPIADAGADQTVSSENIVTLDGSQSDDPDGTIVSYRWTQTDGVPVSLSDPESESPEFTAPQAASELIVLSFTLTVTDDGGLQATDSCTVNIEPVDTTPANVPPVADPGQNQGAAAGEVVQLDGSSSYDPDGSIVAYQWTQTEGEPMILSDPAMPQIEFLAPADITGTITLVFQLTVTDDAGVSNADTVSVTIIGQGQDGQDIPLADLISALDDVLQDSSLGRWNLSSLKKAQLSLNRGAELLSSGKTDRADRYLLYSSQMIRRVLSRLPVNGKAAASLNTILEGIQSQVGSTGTGTPGYNSDDDEDDHSRYNRERESERRYRGRYDD